MSTLATVLIQKIDTIALYLLWYDKIRRLNGEYKTLRV